MRDFNGALRAHTSDGHMTIDGTFTDVDPAHRRLDLWNSPPTPGSKLSLPVDHPHQRRPVEGAPAAGSRVREPTPHTGDGHITIRTFPSPCSGSTTRSRIRGTSEWRRPAAGDLPVDGSIRIAKY